MAFARIQSPLGVGLIHPVIALFMLAIAQIWSGAASAHPHGWVDFNVEVLFDNNGAVVGIRQTWLFDEFYTAFATEGMDRDGDGTPDQTGLNALLEENIRNLAEYDYFTKVSRGEETLRLSTAIETATQIRGNRLEMSFVIPFSVPVRPQESSLVYAVYDPTYYIEMLHAETGQAIRLTNAPEGCDYRLAKPDPDPDAVALAASLDRTQSVGDGLGTFFAERVTVRCESNR